MILNFSVENFRSFNEEVTFSMVASNKIAPHHEHHTQPLPQQGLKALRFAVIYGENGAGKSNFFKALTLFKTMATSLPSTKKTGQTPFRFNGEAKTSSFDLQFLQNGKMYRYGVVYNEEVILEEWLSEVKKKEEVIFERVTSQDTGEVQIEGRLLTSSAKIKALADAGVKPERTFLASMSDYLEDDQLPDPILETLDWFEEKVEVVSPASVPKFLGHMVMSDDDFRDFAGSFLHAASTGVEKITIARKSVDKSQLEMLLPADVYERIMKDPGEDGTVHILGLPNGREILLEKAEGSIFNFLEIHTEHTHENTETKQFNLSEESDGTQRLLHLLPALHALRSGSKVFIIDEVERSMHTQLVRKFIEFFLNNCVGHEQQLIVTTHDTNLLDQKLLRRDSIWFTQKKWGGQTEMYSLMEYPVRADQALEKNYLEGRFGAVPYLGKLEKLIKAR